MRACQRGRLEAEVGCKLTSYGSFFLVAKEGIVPSFCVSAQWKICWYSLGLSSFAAMLKARQWRMRRGQGVAS